MISENHERVYPMIPKLRRKFISITAVALFAMILLVMVAINCIFIYQSNKMLDSRLALIMGEELSHMENQVLPFNFPFSEKEMPNGEPPHDKQQPGEKPWEIDTSQRPLFSQFDKRLRIESNGCLLLLNQDGSLKEIHQQTAEEYSEEELLSIAAAICQGDKECGWHQYFKYYMVSRTTEQGEPEIAIALINASSDLYSIFSMLIISATIGLLSFLLVLLIIVFASGRAVKPIAESYTRQKQFVTDAGHELKTPLTVISANNELARMIYGESEWFDSIDNQVTKMNSLVRSLITLAKMDEEEAPVFAAFNLSDAVYDTAKSFENLIHAGGRLITFDIVDDIFYCGDESKLRQVVSILMDNAAKYCDEKGKIAVRLLIDKQIKMQVINDFSSAAACDFSQVFERFYRADKARTSDRSYGLGLSIAKSIVELHKGEIQAKVIEHDRVMFEVTLNRSLKK